MTIGKSLQGETRLFIVKPFFQNVLTDLSHLTYELAGHGFVELPSGTLLEEFVHFASGGELQDQVDPGLIVKVAEEPQNMAMPGGKVLELTNISLKT